MDVPSATVPEDAVVKVSGPSYAWSLAVGPDGQIYVYDAGSGEILELDGLEPRTLATFDDSPFGSFLALAPGGEALVFGENTAGRISTLSTIRSFGRLLVVQPSIWAFGWRKASTPESWDPAMKRPPRSGC